MERKHICEPHDRKNTKRQTYHTFRDVHNESWPVCRQLQYESECSISKGRCNLLSPSQLWHLYLTQSIMYGIGSSMYYFPIMSLTPVYFDRHRGFAMGFILAGSGVGGLVLAPVLRQLLDRLGVQWALRILGIWNLIVGLPVSCVVRQRPGFGAQAANISTRVNMTLVTKGTFILQVRTSSIPSSLYLIVRSPWVPSFKHRET